MKLKIIYKVGKAKFSSVANNIHEAYELIKAIIDREEINFPSREEILSKYMETLVDFKNDDQISHINNIFAIEKIDEGDKK